MGSRVFGVFLDIRHTSSDFRGRGGTKVGIMTSRNPTGWQIQPRMFTFTSQPTPIGGCMRHLPPLRI